MQSDEFLFSFRPHIHILERSMASDRVFLKRKSFSDPERGTNPSINYIIKGMDPQVPVRAPKAYFIRRKPVIIQ